MVVPIQMEPANNGDSESNVNDFGSNEYMDLRDTELLYIVTVVAADKDEGVHVAVSERAFTE